MNLTNEEKIKILEEYIIEDGNVRIAEEINLEKLLKIINMRI